MIGPPIGETDIGNSVELEIHGEGKWQFSLRSQDRSEREGRARTPGCFSACRPFADTGGDIPDRVEIPKVSQRYKNGRKTKKLDYGPGNDRYSRVSSGHPHGMQAAWESRMGRIRSIKIPGVESCDRLLAPVAGANDARPI